MSEDDQLNLCEILRGRFVEILSSMFAYWTRKSFVLKNWVRKRRKKKHDEVAIIVTCNS